MFQKVSASDSGKNSESFQWLVIQAIIMGLAIRNCFRNSPDLSRIVPLVDLGVAREYIISLGTVWTFAFLFLSVFGRFKRFYYLVTAVLVTAMWAMLYSVAGAFFIHTAIMCLFFFLCDKLKMEDRKIAFQLLFFAIFAAAVSFKFNSIFLAGQEFLPKGSFFYFLYSFKDLYSYLNHEALAQGLAILTICAEISICLLVLFNFRLASHVTCIFFLLLSLLHPPVLYVYFCFLPFVVMSDKAFTEKLEKSNRGFILTSPTFWLAWIAVLQFMRSFSYPLEIALQAIFLIGFHIYWLVKNSDNKKFLGSFMEGAQIQLKHLSGPIIILALVILRLTGAPSPLGYSMFSGARPFTSLKVMRVDHKQACDELSRRFEMLAVNDGGFIMEGESTNVSCLLAFPTASGFNYIKKSICRGASDFTWSYKNEYNQEWRQEKCSSYL